MADNVLQTELSFVASNLSAIDAVENRLRQLKLIGGRPITQVVQIEVAGVQKAISDVNRLADTIRRRGAPTIYGPRGQVLTGPARGSAITNIIPNVKQQATEVVNAEAEAQRLFEDEVRRRRSALGLVPGQFIGGGRASEAPPRSSVASERTFEDRAAYFSALRGADPFRNPYARSPQDLRRIQGAIETRYRTEEAFNRAVASQTALRGAGGGYIPPEGAESRFFTSESSYLGALRRADRFQNPPRPPGGRNGEGGGGLFGRFGQRFASLGYFVGASAILFPISSAIYQSVEGAAKLQTTLLQIQGIFGSKTLGEKLAIRREIVDTATRFSLDINQVAEAAEKFAQQGDSFGKLGTDLQAAAVGAQALGISIERAQQLMTSLENITGQQGGSIFDKIFAVRRGSPVSTETLIQGVEQLLPLVNQLHGRYSGLVNDVDVVLAAISTVSKETNQAASTSLRFVLGRLGNPQTVGKIEALTGVGFGTAESGGKELRPLLNILEDLANVYQRLSAAHDPRALQLLQELAGSRQTRDVAILLKNFGDELQTATRSAYSLGEASEQANRQLSSVQNQLTQIKAKMTAFTEGMLEGSAASGVFEGVLGSINLILNGFSGGITSSITTLGILIVAIAGLGKAFSYLKSLAVTGGLAETLGLSTATIAAGEIGAIVLALGGIYELIKKINESPLAIKFLTSADLQGAGAEHIQAFGDLAKGIGASPASLYNAFGQAANAAAENFKNAKGQIDITRKAFVEDFIGQVIQLAPQFGTYVKQITDGLSPSAASMARLLLVQKIVGQMAYLSNSVANAQLNQVLQAESSLSSTVASELSNLPQVKAGSRYGFSPGGLSLPSTSVLFDELKNAFNSLSPQTGTVGGIILSTAKNMGVLDDALKQLTNDANKNADVWGHVAASLNAALSDPHTSANFIVGIADNLQKAFNADPKHFANLLGFDRTANSGGVQALSDSLHEILQRAFNVLNSRLKGDPNSNLLKVLDEQLRKDVGVRAAFDELNGSIVKINNPIAKFLENMYLTVTALDLNAAAAQRVGERFDTIGERFSAFKEINKQFADLPITSFREYLDQLQTLNQLRPQLTIATNLASQTGLVGQGHEGAVANQDSLQKQVDATTTRVNLLNSVLSVLKGFSVSGIQDNTLSLFRQQGIGPGNPQYEDFQKFVLQFSKDQDALKGLKEGTDAYNEAMGRLVVDIVKLQDFITNNTKLAASDYLAQQAVLRQARNEAKIGTARLQASAEIRKALIAADLVEGRSKLGTSTFFRRGGSLLNTASTLDAGLADRLAGRKGEEGVDISTAEQVYQIQLRQLDAQRVITGMGDTEYSNKLLELESVRELAVAEAHITSIKGQQLDIIQQINKIQTNYTNQVDTNLEQRLTGLKEVLSDIDKLTHGKALATIFDRFSKSFQDRQVQKFLSLFNQDSEKGGAGGVFGFIGKLIGGAGERDPQLDAADYFATTVSTTLTAGADYFAATVGGVLGVSPAGTPTSAGGAGGGIGAVSSVFFAGGLAFTKSKVGFQAPTPGAVPGLNTANGQAFGGAADQKLIDKAASDAAKDIKAKKGADTANDIGNVIGILGGEYAGGHKLPGQRVPTVGVGAKIGATAGTALGSALIPIPGLGGAIGGIVGGFLGGLFDHPKAQLERQALDKIARNSDEQITLIQNTNKLLQASGLAFNVPSRFNLPRYGPAIFGGGGGFVTGGGGVQNHVSISVSVGNAASTADDIGKAVAQAVSSQLEGDYRYGGRYVSTRSKY